MSEEENTIEVRVTKALDLSRTVSQEKWPEGPTDKNVDESLAVAIGVLTTTGYGLFQNGYEQDSNALALAASILLDALHGTHHE